MKSSGGPETFPVRPGSLLAHQGGWDEILLVVGPLLLIGFLLWMANRRVSAQLEASEGQEADQPGEPERANRDQSDR